MAGAVVGATSAEIASAASRTQLTVEVAAQTSTFDSIRSPEPAKPNPTGPFFIEGPIYRSGSLRSNGTPKPGRTAIGTFRCWGWIFNADTGRAVVAQEFKLPHGELQVQGTEDNRRAVTGGTRRYRDARGDGKVEEIATNASVIAFRITLSLASS